MLTFYEYVEKAKKNTQISNSYEIAEMLGMKAGSLTDFIKGRAYPSQDTMLKLANLAGISPERALIDFNLWKTQDKPNAHKVWLKLSKMIGCLILSTLISLAKTNACNAYDSVTLTNIQSECELGFIL